MQRAWGVTCGLVLLLLGWQVTARGPLTGLDRVVEDWLVPRRDGTAGHLARLLLHLGEPVLVVPVFLLVALVRGRASLVRAVALTVALGVAVLALKGLVARPPAHHPHAVGHAWPSGHAATATVVWGSLRSRPSLAVLVPLVVGVCLVVGGYHQVTDVLAGWALGGLLLVLADVAVRRRDLTPR